VLKSMTGYGTAEFSIGEDRFSLEIKSVNHRFVEINVRTPDKFSLLENKIRDEIKQHFSRGSFYVSISAGREIAGAININIPVAKQCLAMLRGLQKELGLKGDIDIELLLKFKEIFSIGEAEQDLEKYWEGLKYGLSSALGSLKKMREEEGSALSDDIASRLNCMEDIAYEMDERAPVVAETYREKLRQRMANMLGNANVDEARLLTEVAIFAERGNITEELVRLKSHFAQFKDMVKLGEPVGRKMDFLCQEILREINTIGSKANDSELANLVVSAKAELEKIREQVQNIE